MFINNGNRSRSSDVVPAFYVYLVETKGGLLHVQMVD
jgi:hypothetical protein